jgi:hypothetical protein
MASLERISELGKLVANQGLVRIQAYFDTFRPFFSFLGHFKHF